MAREILCSPLSGLMYPREGTRKRQSSWDRSGRNIDAVKVRQGETRTFAHIKGKGVIRHIWFTLMCKDRLYPRKAVLRFYWDGEKNPSVIAPLGDFFGVGHGRVNNFSSLPLNMVTAGWAKENNYAAMNCFFAMPFAREARLELTNECRRPIVRFYYHVDYELLPPKALVSPLRFHAQWRREFPTEGMKKDYTFKNVEATPNLDGKGNYVILEARGRGNYVGCNLSIDHFDPIPKFSWFGEGDDMIFIDGERWPPSLHGTGTEDYFGAAWGYPMGEHSCPYHGVSLAECFDMKEMRTRYSGKWTMYRFHVEDPVMFKKSIRVTIEHGHANCHSDDYSSCVYWYQKEPHHKMPEILPVRQRLPITNKESFRRFFRGIDRQQR